MEFVSQQLSKEKDHDGLNQFRANWGCCYIPASACERRSHRRPIVLRSYGVSSCPAQGSLGVTAKSLYIVGNEGPQCLGPGHRASRIVAGLALGGKVTYAYWETVTYAVERVFGDGKKPEVKS
jgi:hypothetical protein